MTRINYKYRLGWGFRYSNMEVFSYLPLQIEHMVFVCQIVILKHFQQVNIVGTSTMKSTLGNSIVCGPHTINIIKGSSVRIETTPTSNVTIIQGYFILIIVTSLFNMVMEQLLLSHSFFLFFVGGKGGSIISLFVTMLCISRVSFRRIGCLYFFATCVGLILDLSGHWPLR